MYWLYRKLKSIITLQNKLRIEHRKITIIVELKSTIFFSNQTLPLELKSFSETQFELTYLVPPLSN